LHYTTICKQLIALISLALFSVQHSVAADIEPGEEIISSVLKSGIPLPKTVPQQGGESQGPFKRLVIWNANVIDGTGAPARGPATIVIKQDRIVDIQYEQYNSAQHESSSSDVKIMDAKGSYILPGFIDSHAHLGTPTHAYAGYLTDPEYVLKLWLAHGITTVRDVGALMGLNWTVNHKKRSEKGEISAPRIYIYPMFPEIMASSDAARAWVRAVRKKGADGIKLRGAAPELIKAVIDEAQKLGMKTAFHHAQTSVSRMNVLDSARMGLDSMEHWYGLPEAMFENKRVQNYPYDYNYSNEQDRFGEAGQLWLQTALPGSAKWNATIDELVGLGFTIDPTFTIYEANRDVMRARSAEWHDDYTIPYIMRAFEPDPKVHGSYHFDWTTSHEIAWKKNYQRWMTFVNDYKNAGGRVTAGSDAGFIYKLYGFSYVRELELLQEAGFHPLEVLQAATLNGAELLGVDKDIGTIQVGKKADLVIVKENPLANFKVLYGTGHQYYDHKSAKIDRTKGIMYTIKDGIMFDAKKLLADVRDIVARYKKYEKPVS